jgi:hypothetical protein
MLHRPLIHIYADDPRCNPPNLLVEKLATLPFFEGERCICGPEM